jgi:hypothetical protein
VTLQVPTASSVAVDPETVQSDAVVDVNVTGKPDDAVAFRLTDPVTNVVAGITAKLMV